MAGLQTCHSLCCNILQTGKDKFTEAFTKNSNALALTTILAIFWTQTLTLPWTFTPVSIISFTNELCE